METRCRTSQRQFATFLLNLPVTPCVMMDPMLTKPKNHKARNPWLLILMIGITLLCFVLSTHGLQTGEGILVDRAGPVSG